MVPPGSGQGRDGVPPDRAGAASARSATVALVPGRTIRSGRPSAGRAVHHPHPDPGLDGQGVQVGEVGDPREGGRRPRRGAVRAPGGAGRARPGGPSRAEGQPVSAEGQGVLGVEADAGEPGQDAEGRDPRAASQLGRSGAEHSRIAPELVDDEAPDGGAQVVGEQGHRPVQGGEHPAPVDVADDDGRQAGVARPPAG